MKSSRDLKTTAKISVWCLALLALFFGGCNDQLLEDREFDEPLFPPSVKVVPEVQNLPDTPQDEENSEDETPQEEGLFRRGDANADGFVNISDVSFIMAYLFEGGAVPPCLDAADVDDDGRLRINDGMVLANYLFMGGLPPAPPLILAGHDPTDDDLDCIGFVP